MILFATNQLQFAFPKLEILNLIMDTNIKGRFCISFIYTFKNNLFVI